MGIRRADVMRLRFAVYAALCVLWFLGLTLALKPLDALRALETHGPDAAIDAPAPSNYDFYRSNEAVQKDSVLRQRRLIASGYVQEAERRLELFQSLATWPVLLGLMVTAMLGWLPEKEPPKAPPRASTPPRWSSGRRIR
jgi:hypothetical protein